MSMGLVLRSARDHLRTALELARDQCAVTPEGAPPAGAGEWFVALAERGVRSEARSVLRELFEVEVAVWRRAGGHPADRRGGLLLPEEPYLAGLQTLDQLERRVLAALHGNFQAIVQAANELGNTADEEGGGVFQLALYYRGRGPTSSWPPRAAPGEAAWLGRRLLFEGMTRVQPRGAIR